MKSIFFTVVFCKMDGLAPRTRTKLLYTSQPSRLRLCMVLTGPFDCRPQVWGTALASSQLSPSCHSTLTKGVQWSLPWRPQESALLCLLLHQVGEGQWVISKGPGKPLWCYCCTNKFRPCGWLSLCIRRCHLRSPQHAVILILLPYFRNSHRVNLSPRFT